MWVQVSLLTLAPDTLLVAFNDMPDARSLLTLASSTDGGDTWRRLTVLESAPTASFHYPTVHLLPDRDLVVVIYSVDVLPTLGSANSRTAQSQWWFRERDNVKGMRGKNRLLNVTTAPVHGVGRELDEGLGAWGRVSLGMRVALLSASELVHIAHL
jgi:hypothetical protein